MMNSEFQSNCNGTNCLLQHIYAIYETILDNYVKKNIILRAESNPFAVGFQDPFNFMSENEWYFGSKVENMMKNKNVIEGLGEGIHSFQVKCLNFYIAIAWQISKRFRELRDVFPLSNACDPAVARVRGIKSVVALFNKFYS